MNKTIFITLLAASLLSACGGSEPTANNGNSGPANTSGSNAVNVNSPVAVTTPTPAATTNNAPTLTPVFKAYCTAMEKKDEAGLRRVFAGETIRDFEKTMKEDGLKSLLEVVAVDNVTTALCDIRNEEITGDTAVAEVKTASMPQGGKLVFLKEGGEWKLTTRVAGFEKK